MEVFGIRLIGITVENGHKLLLSLGAVAVIYLVRLIACER
jgi:hypothetical protein